MGQSSPEARERSVADGCAEDESLQRQVREMIEAYALARDPSGHDSQNSAVEAELARLKPEEPGDRIGRYKLLQQIGEGGFGVVWMAEQVEPVKRRVALKIIKLGMDTKEVIARFEQERQALAMMDHPNIARVLDAGATPFGRPFFVMELVRGITITEYCDQANLSTAERLRLFISVCQAVQHAHQKGIIHRDLKPSNIMVTLHDGTAVPKVIDFGVAKAMQSQGLTELTLFTQFQQMIGTPLYMSPEQAEMSGLDIDTRSDIYSLGVLLYELLTGRTPFDPQELMRRGHDDMLRAIREQEPLKPSTFVSTLALDLQTDLAQHRKADRAKLIGQIRGDLDWIVMKALEKDRTRRYETANGLAMDIRRHLADEPVLARPPSQLYRFRRVVRRNKLVVTATAAVTVALIGGLSFSIWSFRREKRQRQIADTERGVAQEERRTADEQRQIAKANAVHALENEARARRLLYAADISLAQQSLASNNLGRARRLLDRHRPEPGKEDLRGWEWRWLWQECRGEAVTLTQQPNRAFTVSFSPDGRRLAVAYTDGRVELWDLASRTLVKLLQESGPGENVAFSPVSDALAFSAERGIVKWYDFAADRESVLCHVPGHVRELAFSQDGERLAVLTRGKEAVVVVDPMEGRALTTIVLPSGGGLHFNNARISPDHERLYVTCGAFRDPRLRCIRIADGRVLWEADGRVGPSRRSFTGFTAMDLSPDGKVLATASGYNNQPIEIRAAETGQRIGALEGHSRYVKRLAFSRDGRTLTSGSSDETVRLWDTTTWMEAAGPLRAAAPLRGHTDEVEGVAFSPDGQLLATGSRDGYVMLWDQKIRKPAGGRQMLPANVQLAHLLPGGRTVFAADTGSKYSLIDLATLRQTPLPFPENRVVIFAPPNFLGVHDGVNVFQLYHLADAGAKLLAELPLGRSFVPSFAYCAKTKSLAWADGSKTIHITSIDNLRNRTDLALDDENAWPLSFDAEGKILLASAPNDLPRVWEIASQRRLPVAEDYLLPFGSPLFGSGHPNALTSPAILNWISTASAPTLGNRNLLLDSPAPSGFWPRGNWSNHAYSTDGRTFAISTENGLVALFDAAKREKLAVLQGSLHAVFGIAFTPDGTRLAVANDALWDVATRQELLTLHAEGTLHHLAEFSDDGSTLLIGNPEQAGFCQFWRAPSWREIDEAERNGEAWRPTAE